MLFQRSYEHAVMPDVWSTAWITPVFKKGAKFEAANYRPVSLTCVPCKLLEHIIVSHMRGHIDRWSLVHPNQHGFTKNRHCESQLIMTTHDLLSRLDRKDMVDVAVLDFSKAFDTVPHRRLMNKLRLYGIEGKTHAWIDCRVLSLVDAGRTALVQQPGIQSYLVFPKALCWGLCYSCSTSMTCPASCPLGQYVVSMRTTASFTGASAATRIS